MQTLIRHAYYNASKLVYSSLNPKLPTLIHCSGVTYNKKKTWITTKYIYNSQKTIQYPNARILSSTNSCLVQPTYLLNKEKYSNSDVNLDQWYQSKINLSKLPAIYASLSKWYLTLFVVMTMDAGYCLATVPFDQLQFFLATTGTLLCSCSANTLNQIAEVPYDAQMDRTRARPLVRGLLSPLHAFMFASVTGIGGFSLLYSSVNPLTAYLGLSTIVLYSAVYTPLKRKHWFNTWVGSVVGAIPPIMGWTAATGKLEFGAFILSGILYAWQFPHFYALAWRRKGDYARGSYHMLPLSHPEATKHVVLAHSLALWPLCCAAPIAGITSTAFVALSIPLNCWLTYNSMKFNRKGDSKSAQKLYKCSLFYIMLISLTLILDRKFLAKWNFDDEQLKLALPVKTETFL